MNRISRLGRVAACGLTSAVMVVGAAIPAAAAEVDDGASGRSAAVGFVGPDEDVMAYPVEDPPVTGPVHHWTNTTPDDVGTLARLPFDYDFEFTVRLRGGSEFGIPGGRVCSTNRHSHPRKAMKVAVWRDVALGDDTRMTPYAIYPPGRSHKHCWSGLPGSAGYTYFLEFKEVDNGHYYEGSGRASTS